MAEIYGSKGNEDLFLEDLEADYGDVVYYCEVMCFSRGAIPKRFFEPRKEIRDLMEIKEKISNNQWILELAFLTDLTCELNQLNKRLQEKNKLISEMYSDVKLFKMKLKLLIKYIDKRKLDHFPTARKPL